MTKPLEKYLVLQRTIRYLERNREAHEQLKTWLAQMRTRRPRVPRFRTVLEPDEYRQALATLQARARRTRAVGKPAGAELPPHELTQVLAWPPRPLPPPAP